jgi:hypothetical protein
LAIDSGKGRWLRCRHCSFASLTADGIVVPVGHEQVE